MGIEQVVLNGLDAGPRCKRCALRIKFDSGAPAVAALRNKVERNSGPDSGITDAESFAARHKPTQATPLMRWEWVVPEF